MHGFDCPPAPRMGKVNLPSVTSSTPSPIRFVRTHYSRTPPPGVRSPWLHSTPDIMQPMDDHIFVSSPDTPYLPDKCMWSGDAPANESSATSNALGLIFDQPLAGHLWTPASPTLPQPTPQGFVSHLPAPDTSVSQGHGYQRGGQEGRRQSYLATPNSNTGDAQASPSHEQDSSDINPDVTTVGENQETGAVAGANAIATARSVLQDIKESQSEGEAVSFSILTAIVGVLERKMSATQLSGDDIDILDVLGSFQ